MVDVVIVGSGPAGLTAAIYCARAGKKTVLVTGSVIGGQLSKTTHVENYPGFADPILGPDLMDAMYEQAERMNVTMVQDLVQKIDYLGQKNLNNVQFSEVLDVCVKHSDAHYPFSVSCYEEVIQSKAVIVATGADPKLLGNEGHFLGYGVSTCATCDGAFFKNKNVAVIGGGNSALEEAVYLSNIAKKVYLIHRRREFRGEQIMQDRVKALHEKIEIVFPYVIEQFQGDKLLSELQLKNVETGEQKVLEVSGAFIAIGHVPNTKFLTNLFELDGNEYVKPGKKIPGFEFAGDVADQKYRQAITAAGQGCEAAIRIINYLNVTG